LVAGSNNGGKSAAIDYTLIETAKLDGVDPQAFCLRHDPTLFCNAPLTTTLSSLTTMLPSQNALHDDQCVPEEEHRSL